MVIPLFVGPPEVDQGPRGRDGGRQADHAGGAEGRRQGRARAPTTCSRSAASRPILQMLKLPDGTVKVLVEGVQRAPIDAHHRQRRATSSPRRRRCRPSAEPSAEVEALRRAVTQQFDQYVKLNKKIPPEILTSIAGIDDAGPAGRHHRRAPAAQARGEAGSARPVRRRQAAREAARAARARGRHPAGREAHPRSRQAADGEEPARVLPQRAGQGDPEGARRRRRGRRHGGAREEDHAPPSMPKEAREEGRRASSRSSS